MITGENTNTILIKRVFARTIDFIIYMLLCSFILYRIIYIGPSNLMNHFLWIMMVSVPMLLIEPLWIHFTKTTPGKWLMGLSVSTENGNKLELRDAYARTGKILVFGFGFFIPIIVLICLLFPFIE